MPEFPTNPKYDTRQHQDLAAFVREMANALGPPDDLLLESKRRVAERLADRLAKDNPRFDRKRFLEACGVEG